MASHLIALVRCDLARARRSRVALWGGGLLAGSTLLSTFAAAEIFEKGQTAVHPVPALIGAGSYFPVSLASPLLLVWGAALIPQEVSSGVLRTLLASPVTRSTLLGARLLSCGLLAAFFAIVPIATAGLFSLGLRRAGLLPSLPPAGGAAPGGGAVLLLALLDGTLLFTFAAMGLAIGFLLPRTPAQAGAVAVGLFVILLALGNIERLAPFLPPQYITLPPQTFLDAAAGKEVAWARAALSLLRPAVLFVGLSVLLALSSLRRRDW